MIQRCFSLCFSGRELYGWEQAPKNGIKREADLKLVLESTNSSPENYLGVHLILVLKQVRKTDFLGHTRIRHVIVPCPEKTKTLWATNTK